MAAAKGQETSSTASGTTLQQLDGLPLRLIALKLSNPGPLAACCTAAHRSLSHSDFQVDWFLQWVHVLAPLRPWQLAALGWQRLGGAHATPERLAAFLLLAGAAKRQRLPVQLRPDVAPATAQPGICVLTGAAEQQELPQQQQQQQQTGTESTPKKAARQRQHGPMPHFVPSAKVQRQAGRLLTQGKSVAALLWLLPGGRVPAYQYLAAAGNISLLQLLVATQPESDIMQETYPNHMAPLAPTYWRIINTAKLCAYAALRAGNQQMLTMIMLNAGASIKERHYQVWQLFRFAVRHSNAACINSLLTFAPCRDFVLPQSVNRLACWPQHLAMAAARADPWAHEVVCLLLHCMQYTQPKLLAAKYMQPAYTAACRTGHMPVLLQLVQHTVGRTHKEHLAALLVAAAAAGNLCAWQQLLSTDNSDAPDTESRGSGNASSNQQQKVIAGGAQGPRRRGLGSRLLSLLGHVLGRDSHQPSRADSKQQNAGVAQPTPPKQQQQQPEVQQQQQQVMPAAEVLEGLQWVRLTAYDKAFALLAILDGMCTAAVTTGQEPLLLAADADRVAMADSLLSRLGGEGAVRRVVRSMLSEDTSPYATFGGLQELLACPRTPPGKVAWLSEHQMLPLLPDTWQFSPAAQVGLERMISFSLGYGQRRMTDALVQLAWGQGMSVSTQLLVQGCFQCALRDAAAAQDLGEMDRLAAFAEYNSRLAAFASSAWQAVSSQNLPKNELLLSAFAAAWNAAVVLDAEGYPQQLGMPLRQHLKLCCEAVMPVVLQGLPARTMQRMVFEFWWCWTGWGSKCLLQGSQEEVTEHRYLACCALHLHLFLHCPTVSAWRLQSTEPVDFLQCLVQLAAQWRGWVAQGPQRQVLPCNSGSSFAALPLDAAQLPVSPAAAGGCNPCCGAAGSVGTGGVQPLAEALKPLPLVPIHLLAAAILNAAAEDEVPLVCYASDRSAAAHTDSSSSAETSGIAQGQAWQDKLLFPMLHQPVSGAKDSALAATGGTDSADRAAAVGQTAAVAAITSTPAGTCAPRQGGIMPLWQHAALALAAKQGHSWDLKLQFSVNEAVLAILQGPQRASRGSMGTSAGTSAGTSSCSRSPSFLSAAVSAAQPADTAAGTSEQQVSPAPPAPPEHIPLRHVLSSRRWLKPSQPAQQQDDDSVGDAPERPVWPMSALHRMDATAWALHQSTPDASSPLLCKEQRKRMEIALLLALRDGTVVFRTPEWLRKCEQQLQQHHQRMSASAATSSDAEVGALPGFAAGAADATSALLAAGLPAHISKLVSQLNGGSSAAHIEHVKAVIAAMLAAPRKHLATADQQMRQTGLGEETWPCVRPVALRKALEVGDRDLFTLLWLYNEWVWGFKAWPAEGEGAA